MSEREQNPNSGEHLPGYLEQEVPVASRKPHSASPSNDVEVGETGVPPDGRTTATVPDQIEGLRVDRHTVPVSEVLDHPHVVIVGAGFDGLYAARALDDQPVRVTVIEPDAVILGDQRIATRTVLWAAGITPAPLGKRLGVAVDRSRRVIVGRDLTIEGHPEVFVIGDMASVTD